MVYWNFRGRGEEIPSGTPWNASLYKDVTCETIDSIEVLFSNPMVHIVTYIFIVILLYSCLFMYRAIRYLNNENYIGFSTISAYCADPKKKEHRFLLLVACFISLGFMVLHSDSYISWRDEEMYDIHTLAPFILGFISAFCVFLIGFFPSDGNGSVHDPDDLIGCFSIKTSKTIHVVGTVGFIFSTILGNLWNLHGLYRCIEAWVCDAKAEQWSMMLYSLNFTALLTAMLFGALQLYLWGGFCCTCCYNSENSNINYIEDSPRCCHPDLTLVPNACRRIRLASFIVEAALILLLVSSTLLTQIGTNGQMTLDAACIFAWDCKRPMYWCEVRGPLDANLTGIRCIQKPFCEHGVPTCKFPF